LSAQYSVMTFCSSVSAHCNSTMRMACCSYSGEPYSAGGPGRYWSPEASAKGLTRSQAAARKIGVRTAPLASV
jgi:hypothetical protein